ncbi:MAG: hypothetical protein IPM16_09520 [Chloroflexi bacterium]|nr:hypothetical protein [Chloroflexota bacterium]
MIWHWRRPGLLLRWNGVLCAVMIFLWSGPEDTRIGSAVALGVWAAVSLGTYWASRYSRTTFVGWKAAVCWAAFGSAVGAGAALCTVLVMLFKDVRHAHPFPDFPPGLLAAMIARIPAWAAAGALLGISFGLVRAALDPRSTDAAAPDGHGVL